MADGTKIEWTDATWNPITGCTIKSPGCTNCYAMKLAGTRLQHHPSRAGLTTMTKAGPVWTGEVRFNAQWLDQPLRWKRPRMIFVCAHGDLFAPGVKDEWIDRVFAVMVLCPRHKFQVLTKRPERMQEYLLTIEREPQRDTVKRFDNAMPPSPLPAFKEITFPAPNIWLGCSVEDQTRADERREPMRRLAEMGWLTWVSYEPAIGPVDWAGWEFLKWMVSGGESGDGARPSHPAWHRMTRDWCGGNRVAYHFKQYGAWGIDDGTYVAHQARDIQCAWLDGEQWRFAKNGYLAGVPGGDLLYRVGKSRAGRLLDGREWNQFPEAVV